MTATRSLPRREEEAFRHTQLALTVNCWHTVARLYLFYPAQSDHCLVCNRKVSNSGTSTTKKGRLVCELTRATFSPPISPRPFPRDLNCWD